MSTHINIDRSFDGFFYSFGIALGICTLLVSIGKLLSHYYFVYIIIIFLVILITLASYDYNIKFVKIDELSLENTMQISTKFSASKGKQIVVKVDAPQQRISADAPSNDKECCLRKQQDCFNNGLLQYENGLKVTRRNVGMSSPTGKSRRQHSYEREIVQKGVFGRKPLTRQGQLGSTNKKEMCDSPMKERKKYPDIKNCILMNTSRLKKGFSCNKKFNTHI